ncbi:hypothetical protein [Botrimarina sp.]|uniref:hypothetical protein n=1 Tax=Botrimarina sp. TaxID=2795802 RepID=UPI0032EFEC3E
MDEKIDLSELAAEAQKRQTEQPVSEPADDWTPDFETSGVCGGKGGGGSTATIATVPNF